MPSPGLRPRPLAAVLVVVLISAGVLVWALGRGHDPAPAASDGPATTAPASAPALPAGSPSPPPSSAPSGPHAAPSTPPDGGTPTGRPSAHPSDRPSGHPTGVPTTGSCGAPAGRGPVAPVPADAAAPRIRAQVTGTLQLLREMAPPSAVQAAVDGLRSYYRRVGELAPDGDGSLDGAARSQVEQLTQEVYARFAPPVLDYLSRRC
ncbi:hypothetical protein [Nocardioides nitrophenolicus]|uniref:hypothetical protein n=1 Tax=Nocardioides nitrophenolicus TaxID=60489 RepID=UPI0019593421|nr:hypothetical protein [Nocardioides nitrophenolicus]MBM7518203.1 hypothetical protein [Nocardioides nitrophenolicus]